MNKSAVSRFHYLSNNVNIADWLILIDHNICLSQKIELLWHEHHSTTLIQNLST